MKRAFISFDFDMIPVLKYYWSAKQSTDTPFSIADFSIKEAISSDWKAKARTRIRGCDVVIVLCGEYTHTASGVSAELSIAQEENVPYFLLKGYSDKILHQTNHSEIC